MILQIDSYFINNIFIININNIMDIFYNKISVIILNHARPTNVKYLIKKLLKIPEINDIIICHGKLSTYTEYLGVNNIKQFEDNRIYGGARRFFIIDKAECDYVLFIDDDHFPSPSLIKNLISKMNDDPFNIYGPYRRLANKYGYHRNTFNKGYNVIITPILMTHKSIVKGFMDNFELYRQYLINTHGNGEDLLLNHYFITTYNKTPIYVDGKYNTFNEDISSYRGKSDHIDVRRQICKIFFSDIN